ncbi:MAG TPA: serine/threonine-protein kinase, partial [Polyangia bacterium]|nr:serine/threonine-protein kinase [Polyangia bacterium]
MRAADAKPGATLDGRFLLTEELGKGGMATIFKAEDLANDRRPVVVKVPLPVFSSGTGAWSLFQREEEIGRQLDHPYVLKFVPLPFDKRRFYIVTEYVEGRLLSEQMRAKGQLPESEALSIASQVCAAVAHVHDHGVVHYDVKPQNVILCPDGTIRLIDFGLAHAAVTARFALRGAPPPIASSNYAAPEQIRRARGRKSVDIYAIGAMLYEMVTGQAPFPGDDPFVVASARTIGDPPAPRTLNPRLSPEAEEIVLRALRRDPAERYPTVSALKADLDNPRGVVMSGLAGRLQPVTRGRK